MEDDLNTIITERYYYFYLICLRTHINTKNKVFKLGRTLDVYGRFRGYPKGSVLLYLCRVKDAYHVECEMIKIFTNRFTRKLNIGLEYFKGDINELIQCATNVIDHMNQKVDTDDNFRSVRNKYKNYLKFKLDDNDEIVEEEYEFIFNTVDIEDVKVPEEPKVIKSKITTVTVNLNDLTVNTDSYIEKVIETKIPNKIEYTDLSNCDPSDITENNIYAMTKHQLVCKQSLIDTTPEEVMNECIMIYSKNENIMNMITYCNKIHIARKGVMSTTKVKDVENDKIIEKNIHFKSAYDKTVTALDYEYINEIKTIKANDFDERFKNVEYTKAEIMSLDSRGIMKNKFQIVKAILARCGISFTSQSTRIYENKKRVRVINYILSRDEKIYNIVYNIVANNEDEYNDDFMLMIKSYDKYQEYVINKNAKKKQRYVVQRNKINNIQRVLDQHDKNCEHINNVNNEPIDLIIDTKVDNKIIGCDIKGPKNVKVKKSEKIVQDRIVRVRKSVKCG
jgi:hypothetical protein